MFSKNKGCPYFVGKSGFKYYLLLLLLGIIIFLKVPFFLLVQVPKYKKSSRKKPDPWAIFDEFWPFDYRNLEHTIKNYGDVERMF